MTSDMDFYDAAALAARMDDIVQELGEGTSTRSAVNALRGAVITIMSTPRQLACPPHGLEMEKILMDTHSRELRLLGSIPENCGEYSRNLVLKHVFNELDMLEQKYPGRGLPHSWGIVELRAHELRLDWPDPTFTRRPVPVLGPGIPMQKDDRADSGKAGLDPAANQEVLGEVSQAQRDLTRDAQEQDDRIDLAPRQSSFIEHFGYGGGWYAQRQRTPKEQELTTPPGFVHLNFATQPSLPVPKKFALRSAGVKQEFRRVTQVLKNKLLKARNKLLGPVGQEIADKDGTWELKEMSLGFGRIY